MRRNKEDAQGNHPWKAEVEEAKDGSNKTLIDAWHTTVYEPSFDKTPAAEPERRRN